MVKQELLAQLENAKNNYILGLAALSLFNSQETYHILDKLNCVFGSYNIKFDTVVNLHRKEEDRYIALNEFLRMLLRALIKETFEVIKDYCDASGQISSFKAQSFYHVARMIRNCLSHNFRFIFNTYDMTLLPVNWKGRTITTSMNGTFLERSFFGYVESWELFTELQSFARDILV
jgi:hypothetical protein